jgi:hypothetical protein
VEKPCHGHHVVDVVERGQARAEEHPSEVYVVRDITPGGFGDFDMQVAFQDLDRRGRLLLRYSREGIEVRS